jgi:hypothetical protein
MVNEKEVESLWATASVSNVTGLAPPAEIGTECSRHSETSEHFGLPGGERHEARPQRSNCPKTPAFSDDAQDALALDFRSPLFGDKALVCFISASAGLSLVFFQTSFWRRVVHMGAPTPRTPVTIVSIRFDLIEDPASATPQNISIRSGNGLVLGRLFQRPIRSIARLKLLTILRISFRRIGSCTTEAFVPSA